MVPAQAGTQVLTGDDWRERDRGNIVAAPAACGGNIFGRSGAAELLDVKRKTLASRMKTHGIRPMRTNRISYEVEPRI